MARISNDEYKLASMPDGDLLDFETADVRTSTDPLSLIHPDVVKLVEHAWAKSQANPGQNIVSVKVISGYADRIAAKNDAAKVVRQAKKYGEVRPEGRVTVGATVVENYVRPDGKGTIPLVVTVVAKEYKPRERKATGVEGTAEKVTKASTKTSK